MVLVKHKLLMAKSCCTFQGFKKINVPFIHTCANMSCDLVCCAEKYTKKFEENNCVLDVRPDKICQT